MHLRTWLLLAVLPLALAGACAERPGRPESAEALLARADAEAAARKPAEAAGLYARAVDAAVAGNACREAGTGARGLLETVYLSLDPAPLRAAEATVLGAFPNHPCLFEAVTQVALAWDLLSETAAGRTVLDRARASAPDSLTALRLDRAIRLYARDPATVLNAERARTMPTGPEDTLWAGADTEMVDRPDQVRLGAESWRGPDDASLTLRSALLLENLYVLIDVRDDDLRSAADRADSLFLVVNPVRGRSSFHRRDPWGSSPPLLFRIPVDIAEAPLPLPGSSHAWYRSWTAEGGVTVLACLPKGAVQDFTASEGDGYVFDVIYRDRDADGESLLRAWEVDPDYREVFLGGTLMLPDELE